MSLYTSDKFLLPYLMDSKAPQIKYEQFSKNQIQNVANILTLKSKVKFELLAKSRWIWKQIKVFIISYFTFHVRVERSEILILYLIKNLDGYIMHPSVRQ